jgi:hypothetical protein
MIILPSNNDYINQSGRSKFFFSSNIGVCDLKWVVVPLAVSCEFTLGQAI